MDIFIAVFKNDANYSERLLMSMVNSFPKDLSVIMQIAIRELRIRWTMQRELQY